MKDNYFIKSSYKLLKSWLLVLLLAIGLPCMVNDAYSKIPITSIAGQIQPGMSPDTVVFYYFRDYLYGNVGLEKSIVPCDKNGHFRLNISDAAVIGRISMVVNGSSRAYLLDHYLQRGDAITLAGNRTAGQLGFKFSGVGASKFDAKQRLDSVTAKSVMNMKGIADLTVEPLAEEYAKLPIIFRRLDYTAKMQLEMLKELETTLPKQIFQLMRCDVRSYALERKYFNYRFFAGRNKGTRDNWRYLEMFYELESSSQELENDTLLRVSKNYLELLISIAKARDFVYGEQGLQQTYRLLKYASPSALRSRVVTSLLLSTPQSEKPGIYQHCLEDAVKSTADPVDQKVLKQLLTAYQQGSKMIDFQLTKKDGSTFENAKLLGKVVLIDFWFTGCTSCVKQASEFNRQVMPKIKSGNIPVTILSVNLDKKMQDWKQSLAGGKYNIDGSIELFTNGQAFDHPLAKFYQIQSCPRLLVFDQSGQLVASDPPIATLMSLINGLIVK